MFEKFYKLMVEDATKKLKKNIDGYEGYVENGVYCDFNNNLNNMIQNIMLRTLIVKLHEYKQRGVLVGNNPEEEYDYFNCNIVSKESFIQETLTEFPVLSDIISNTIDNAVGYYTQIILHFAEDIISIEKILGKRIKKISGIMASQSDIHNHGKQVMKIQFDSKDELLYKPHSMENEKVHANLLKWLEERTGIKHKIYDFISFNDHSWSAIVEYNPCESKIQLDNYYVRLGQQLFVAYALGTKDLHCENIIASGEFPVLIDLEAIVNIRMNEERSTVNEEIKYELLQSVLYTGLLPVLSWNQLGNGIDISGILGSAGKKCHYKIPYVLNQGTSNMRIDYCQPVLKQTLNLATLNGTFIHPALYEKQIIKGFKLAYNCVLRFKSDFMRFVDEMRGNKIRYLLLDTQRYTMMISSSYHPTLLLNEESREKFLNHQRQGRNRSNEHVIESEIASLRYGNVPYFYFYLDKKSLYDCDDKEIAEYFSKKPLELIVKKINRFRANDLDNQIDLICTSLRLSNNNIKVYMNKVHNVEELNLKGQRDLTTLQPTIQKLKKRILSSAIWDTKHIEVNWYSTHISTNKEFSWNMHPVGLYLYDGLAGILLIMYALLLVEKDNNVAEIYIAIKRQLFKYTDMVNENKNKLIGRNSGAYTGESSIIYTYICLYRLTKEQVYLEYAEKHALAIEFLLDYDQNYDLLSGNAGAILVLCLLYSINEKKEFLLMAIKASRVLMRNVKKKETGIGWASKENDKPMTGMAHGNSGILMAILTLWRHTGDYEYLAISKKILSYEDSLYNLEMNNWMDLQIDKHNLKEENGSVAWCHGVGGILLSRLKCLKMVDNSMLKKILQQDINLASEKLKKYWKRDSWSLCHGICGNLWALGKIDNQKYWYHDDINYLPQEIINPGLMNGYGGVLYYLLVLFNNELPDILTLD